MSTKYVDPAGTGNYTSLVAWEAGEQGANTDLTSGARDNEIVLAICQTTDESADPGYGLTIDGWTTDAGGYLSITVDEAYQSAGKWDATKYRVLVYDNAYAIQINEDYTRIDGLQISQDAASIVADYKYQVYSANTATNIRLTNCVIRGHGNATYPNSGVYFAGTSKTFYLVNCVLQGHAGYYAVRLDNYGGEVLNVYGCTIVGSSQYALKGGSNTTINATNCYAGGQTVASYASDGTLNLTTCAASDGGGTSAALDNILVSTTADATHAGFTNVTAGSENYAIKVGSPLIDAGTDLGSSYNTDILGASRGATWDIGAFEYVAAGGGLAIPIVMHHLRELRG